MIKLMFVFPFPIERQLRRILADTPFPEEIEYRSIVRTYLELDDYEQKWRCDAIIARGYTADVLEKHGSGGPPVYKTNFTSGEAVNAIIRCRDRFQPKKIAVVCHPSLSLAAKTLSRISGIPIRVYSLDSPYTKTGEVVEEAVRDGCDALVGGGVSHHIARERALNSVLVESEDQTLRDIIDRAVRTLIIQRQERERAEILRTVMDNSREGLMLIGRDGRVGVCNHLTDQVLGNGAGTCAGQDFLALLPEFSRQFERVGETLSPVGNEMFARGAATYSAALTPLVVDRKLNAVLVSFQDVGRIQEMESHIRNKLHAKGMSTRYRFDDIIHSHSAMSDTIDTAKRFAGVDSNVLLEGETGTGKEMFAQSIHSHSARSGQPFVAVNCTVLTESLLESELFGYSPGAFTGASREGKKGLFELAHGGTLFLDEVSEIPYSFQGKLLRALQEREIRRIGDNKVTPVNVRVIAATNRDLLEMAEQGLFRKDLYFRLDILSIRLPALKHRREDIMPLFSAFVREFAGKFRRPVPPLSHAGQALLENHPWIGNIRELRNIAERLVVLWDGGEADAARTVEKILFRPSLSGGPPPAPEPLADQEKRRIAATLAACSNRETAAKKLGFSRSTLWRKVKAYGL